MKPSLMVWNLQEAPVKPFNNVSNEIFMFWNLQEAAAIIHGLASPGGCCETIYTHFQRTKVLKSPGGCFEAIIDGLKSRGRCCEAIYIGFQLNICVFESPGCMRGAAVTPFNHYYLEILMIWNCRKAAVKPFLQFDNEILILC